MMNPPLLSMEDLKRMFDPVGGQHHTVARLERLERSRSYEDSITDKHISVSATTDFVEKEDEDEKEEEEEDEPDEDTDTPAPTSQGSQKVRKRRRNHRGGKRKTRRSTDGSSHFDAIRAEEGSDVDSGNQTRNQNPHIRKLCTSLSIHALLLPRLNALPTNTPGEAAEVAKLHGCLGRCERYLHTLLRAAEEEEDEEDKEGERVRELCVDVLELVAASVIRREQCRREATGDVEGDDGEDEKADGGGVRLNGGGVGRQRV